MLLCRIGFSFNDFCVGMNGRQKQLTETKTSYTGMFFFKAFTCRHWFFIRIKKTILRTLVSELVMLKKGVGCFFLTIHLTLTFGGFAWWVVWPLENMKSQVQGNYGKYVQRNFFRLIDKFLILCPWSVGNINSHNFLFACLAGINNVDVTHEQ